MLSCDGRRSLAVPAGARVTRAPRRAAGADRAARPSWSFADRLVAKFQLPVRSLREAAPDSTTTDRLARHRAGAHGRLACLTCWRSCASAASASSTTPCCRSGPGLTVVTGETGAGKTMVVTGLLLLFGGRADAAGCAPGADQASVDGRLELDADRRSPTGCATPAATLDDGDGLVLRRVVSAAGRSRAYVGGAPAPVAVLAELAERLVAVHGQSDQLRLTRPARAARGAGPLRRHRPRATTAAAFQRWRAPPTPRRPAAPAPASCAARPTCWPTGWPRSRPPRPQPGEDAELAAAGAAARRTPTRCACAARLAHDALARRRRRPASRRGRRRRACSARPAARSRQQARRRPRARRAGRPARPSSPRWPPTSAPTCAPTPTQLDADPARLAADRGAPGRADRAGPQVRATRDSRRRRRCSTGPTQARDRLAELDVSDEALAALTRRARRAPPSGRGRRRRDCSRAPRGRGRRARRRGHRRAGRPGHAGAHRSRSQVRPRRRAPEADAAGRRAELPSVRDGADDVEFLLRPHPDAPALPLGRGASGGELSG